MAVGRKMSGSKGGLVLVALLALTFAGRAMAREMPGMGGEMHGGMASPAASPVACPDTPAALPGELSGWDRHVPLTAARDAGAATRLQPGTAVDGTLSPTPEVRYALRPEKPGGSVSFGGIYAFTVSTEGHYRVALGSAAWIDVIKADDAGKDNLGKALTSIAHGHGPDCSGIRKMVDFALEPGNYLLQISANAEVKLPLLVTRLP